MYKLDTKFIKNSLIHRGTSRIQLYDESKERRDVMKKSKIKRKMEDIEPQKMKNGKYDDK
jgi:hypothetical protein